MSKSLFYSDGSDLVMIDLNTKSKSLITMKSSHADENIIFLVKEQHNGKLVLFSGDFSMKLYNENAMLGPKIWTMCGYICPYCLKSCLCPGDLKKRHLKCHYGPVACKSCKVKWSTEGTLFILIYFQEVIVDHDVLRDHMKQCLFSCEKCQKKFKYLAQLKRHKLAHKIQIYFCYLFLSVTIGTF